MWLCHFIALLKATDDQQQRYDKVAAYICIILFFIMQFVLAAVEVSVYVSVCVCVCVFVCVYMRACVIRIQKYDDTGQCMLILNI